ncbi:unnamed protein product [Durusdinium trenchii]|uniref:PUM-HD domain-containing protein n=2 Tax=Durusdinium trenchii TaxID=1381693 RepID=A0ABP0HVL6_9DINO
MAPWQEEILVPGRPSTLKLSEYLESGPHVPSGPPPGLDLPLTLLERRSGPQIPQVREPTKRMKRMAFTSFLRTPNGAEETCLKLDSAMLDSSYVAELVAAVLPDLPSLACDPQGIQDKHGCWFMQQALHFVPCELQELIQEELKGKILACSQHLHGNFVLQKCVELLPGTISFIIKELKNHVMEAAMHVYSCRVLQRIIERNDKRLFGRPDMIGVLETLLRLENLQKLVIEPYGNNVIRAVLACGTSLHVQKIMKVFACGEAGLLALARNRHGSLVLEKLLETLNGELRNELQAEREALMCAILGGTESSLFVQIALDRFGNYIAQRTIEVSEGQEQQRVQELLKSLGPKLRRAANGRHILQAARKRFGSTLSVTDLGS